MSVRRPATGALGRATPPGKVAPARRLDAVLRAGVAVGRPVDESGLTRALKQASITPTGACVPRNFDPDYCAYDGYYGVGVALVSAAIGVFSNTQMYTHALGGLIHALEQAMSRQCHTPQPENQDGLFFAAEPNPQAKQWDQLADDQHHIAQDNFSFGCRLVLSELNKVREANNPAGHDRELVDSVPIWMRPIVRLILTPSKVALESYHELKDGTIRYNRTVLQHALQAENALNAPIYLGTLAYTLAYTLKYVSRYMNEHAMMIASFFRVNAKRLNNGQTALLDLGKFVEMCKKDIANGSNPPPPPPAYEEFEPEAEAKRRHLADLRERTHARDPLMAGFDYPETYASARDA
tara:strand:- start:8481 stop:9536 length:1056 start_codon:yes stop_codon:yes gene_type:complete